MKMAVGADSVSQLSNVIIEHIKGKGIEPELCGKLAGKEADYVDTAVAVAQKVSCGECEKGLLFCNTGTGVTIVANKLPKVRAALCINEYTAEISRLANNANVLVLSVFFTGIEQAKRIVDTWLATEPSTEARRVRFHQKTDEVDLRYRKTIRHSADC